MFTRPALPLHHPATVIATWFGSGLMPKAPGTWGSLAALPVGALLLWIGGPWVLMVGILVATAAGLWATKAYTARSGRKDPSDVVIDEVAGQWIALIPAGLPTGLNPLLMAVAFLAFRLFDIWKPWPVGWIDRSVAGAWGVMADDLAAGLYAALVTLAVALLMG